MTREELLRAAAAAVYAVAYLDPAHVHQVTTDGRDGSVTVHLTGPEHLDGAADALALGSGSEVAFSTPYRRGSRSGWTGALGVVPVHVVATTF